MSNMQFLVFDMVDGDFPVLKDPVLNKKLVYEKYQTTDRLILGLSHKDEAVLNNQIMVLSLKYTDTMQPLSAIVTDRTPVMYKDYYPSEEDMNKKKSIRFKGVK